MATSKHILIIGMNPYTIDFSLPGFMPGLTAEKVEKGIEAERQLLLEQGYTSALYLIDSGSNDLSKLEEHLKLQKPDAVMIGAGVRVPPINFLLFEKLVNTIHHHAPATRFTFNTNPADTLEAVKRWI